ncbi:hypothetical protein CQJ94_16220 [Glycomyces fuscus]|nr:hypothetical protein CQJ94_16220 [Glycomyces fuscus]
MQEGEVRCPFGSRGGQTGVNLVYSEGFTLADMPDIEDNYETVAEMRDVDLHMTDRVSTLGGVLETMDMGDVQEGRGVRLHLPGGLFISAVSVGGTLEQALSEEELDEILAEAAEALV